MVKFTALRNAKVSDSKVLNVAKDVAIEMKILTLIKENASITITEMVKLLAVNRRTIQRVLLNWMLRKRGLPPIYFKHTEKASYYAALERADRYDDYSELLHVMVRGLFRTIMKKMR